MKKLLITAAVVFSGIVVADSAVMFEFPDGRTVALTSSGEIEMVAESVSIVPAGGMYESWPDEPGWLPLMNVRCVFDLLNISEDAQEITVGFPIDANFGDSYTVLSDSMLVAHYDTARNNDERIPWHSSGLEDGEDIIADIPEELNFTAEADGIPLDVFYRSCMYSLEEEMIRRPVVAVWRMHFDPGQRVRLVNTYSTAWDYSGLGPWADYTMAYILTTGSTWRGSIGSAVITLEVPREFPRPVLDDTLFACWDWSGSPVIDGSTVRWEYSDLEPDEDIEFSIITEIGINHWDHSVLAGSLIESVVWTEEELLSSAFEYLKDELTWGPTYHTELAFCIVEASVYLRCNQSAPDSSILMIFSSVHLDDPICFSREDLQKLKVIHAVGSDLQRDRDLIKEAGYYEFLPRFSVTYKWDTDDIVRFSAMETHEGRYLDLLENLHAAQTGAVIEDPAIRAFYNLTGWYHTGDSLSLFMIADISRWVRSYRDGRGV